MLLKMKACRPIYVFHCVVLLPFSVLLSMPESLAADPAWHSFRHSLGEPALIAANADHPEAKSAFRPMPPAASWRINPDKFRLGFRLFHESRLSSGSGVACVTCHAGALSGADRRRVSIGVGGAAGRLNALSVFNAAFNFRQFWDGRAVTLEDQALLPIETEFEMANTLDAVVAFLEADPEYTGRFEQVYPDGVSNANMADAMAHYQRSTFIRLDTPFQRHLSGDDNALGELEKFGLQRFTELGCSSCHNGINLGGNSYQKLGSLRPYYGEADSADEDDAGLASRTGRATDTHVFRVPGLHGVATTPPYFHDGSIATLEEAVRLMGEYQLGRSLAASDIAAISAFLRATGGHFNSSRSGLPFSSTDVEAETGEWQLVTDSMGEEPGDNQHERAYRNVLQSITGAQAQLLQELDALTSGQLAHFDFLQFQHMELIRYSRALLHPPSTLSKAQHTLIVEQADLLFRQVMALELVIADFLQAFVRAGDLQNLLQQAESELVLLSRDEAESVLTESRQQLQQSLAEIRTQVQDQVRQLAVLRNSLQ
jgi:cytochrome c peroxidase